MVAGARCRVRGRPARRRAKAAAVPKRGDHRPAPRGLNPLVHRMARDARRWSGVAERVGSLVGMSMQGSTAATSPLMTPAEVARLAHVSKATIYREISRG